MSSRLHWIEVLSVVAVDVDQEQMEYAREHAREYARERAKTRTNDELVMYQEDLARYQLTMHQLAKNATENYFAKNLTKINSDEEMLVANNEIAAYFEVAQAFVVNTQPPTLLLVDARYSNRKGRPYYAKETYPHSDWIDSRIATYSGSFAFEGMRLLRCTCVLNNSEYPEDRMLTMYLADECESTMYENVQYLFKLFKCYGYGEDNSDDDNSDDDY